MGFFFSDLGLGGRKKHKYISSENDQLTGHFQSFFLKSLQNNSKTSKINLKIYHHFPKTLDRTITFNSATLKNAQTEHLKYIYIFFNETNNI